MKMNISIINFKIILFNIKKKKTKLKINLLLNKKFKNF